MGEGNHATTQIWQRIIAFPRKQARTHMHTHTRARAHTKHTHTHTHKTHTHTHAHTHAHIANTHSKHSHTYIQAPNTRAHTHPMAHMGKVHTYSFYTLRSSVVHCKWQLHYFSLDYQSQHTQQPDTVALEMGNESCLIVDQCDIDKVRAPQDCYS